MIVTVAKEEKMFHQVIPCKVTQGMSPLPHGFFREIWKPWKYWSLTPSGSEFMAFWKSGKLMMIGEEAPNYNNFLDNFYLKSRLVLKILLGMFCDFRNSKMTPKLPLNQLVLSYKKILSKFTMQYISINKNEVAL